MYTCMRVFVKRLFQSVFLEKNEPAYLRTLVFLEKNGPAYLRTPFFSRKIAQPVSVYACRRVCVYACLRTLVFLEKMAQPIFVPLLFLEKCVYACMRVCVSSYPCFSREK